MKNFFKKESPEEKFEQLLAQVGYFPNAAMDALGYEYDTISKKSFNEIFDYLHYRSDSKEFLSTTLECTSIVLGILKQLLFKFRDNDNSKNQIPVNFEKRYFEAVKNIEDFILLQKKRGNIFHYYEDIDFDNYPGNGFSGYSYRIYKKKAEKIKDYYKFIENEPDYNEFLNKFGLEEKQAFSIFGKYWYYVISRENNELFWNVQRSILRIKRSSKYRNRLEPYFESTLGFFENVLERYSGTISEGFKFKDIFEWDYNLSFNDPHDIYFWEEVKRFSSVAGKYSEFFEKVIDSHYDESILEEDFDEDSDEEEDEYEDREYEEREYEDREYEEREYEEREYEEREYEETENEVSANVLQAYEVLELQFPASREQIKKRYRVLSLKYHPDRNKSQDTTEIMKNINNAYEIINQTFEG